MRTEIYPTQTKPVESTLGKRERDFYIDCLRTVMIALVILLHTAIIYGAWGDFAYHERRPSATLSSVILKLFASTNQAYLLGFLFLLAGYFTPGSLERKGYARFLSDRFLRLGLPLLGFGLIYGALSGKIFVTGLLWFLEALLMFSLAYCGWRAWFGAPLASAQRVPRPVPRYSLWLLSALGVSAAALGVRQVVPATGVDITVWELRYFPSYIFLFSLGIAAWRHDWLRQLKWEHARPWIITLAVAWPSFPVVMLVTSVIGPGKSNSSGSLSWAAIHFAFWEPFIAFWEPFIAWGLIAGWLLLFRRYMNRPSSIWAWLNRRSYAVYIIHAILLVGISQHLLSGWAAPALVKFAVTGTLACATSWILADPLVRMPGLRRIV